MVARFVLICGFSLLQVIWCGNGSASEHPEWGILYWMPYDGSSSELANLAPSVQPTMDLFKARVQSSKVVVVVQRDLRTEAGHVRTIFRGDGKPHEESVAATDSSDPKTLQNYLEWARRTIDAQRWVVAVLGHSGRLSEISPDEYPDQKVKQVKWMHIDGLATAIQGAWEGAPRKLDLLVLQTCTKGMIEVVFSLRNAADLTLASQAELGDHDDSYTEFLLDLSDRPHATPSELAKSMMSGLHPNVFLSQVLVDNRMLEELPVRLAPLLAEIRKAGAAPSFRELVQYGYPQLAGSEIYSDFLALLGTYANGSQEARVEYEKFSKWMKRAVTHRRGNLSLNVQHVEKLTGLGVLLPVRPETYKEHSTLSFYRATKLWDQLRPPRSP